MKPTPHQQTTGKAQQASPEKTHSLGILAICSVLLAALIFAFLTKDWIDRRMSPETPSALSR